MRINSAADGPASLVISEQLRSRIGELRQKIDNTAITIDKYNTADGALMSLRSVAADIRADLVAASNGANEPAQQAAYQNSVTAAVSSYNDLIKGATFGSTHLVDGSAGSIAKAPSLEGLDASTPEAARQSLIKLEDALSQIDVVSSNVGATVRYDLEAQRSSMLIAEQNLTAAEATVRGADYLREISVFAGLKAQLLASAYSTRAHNGLTAEMTKALLYLP